MGVAENIINSVVEITRHNEEHALAESLVTTVNELLDVDLIFLLETTPVEANGKINTRTSIISVAGAEIGDAKENQSPVVLPATVKIFTPLLEKCLQQQEMQLTVEAEQSVCALPIAHDADVLYVLCLKHRTLSESDIRIVQGMVRIFCNYLRILSQGKHDTLTGLLNRRVFLEKINKTIHLSKFELNQFSVEADRRQPPVESGYWLAIFDIDHFKKINDTFGHIYGDEVLIMFSNLMRECFRASDLLFRYGGEEFVAVIGAMDEAAAKKVFERFRERVAKKSFGQLQQVTVSIGMVQVESGDDPTSLVGHADQALYFAKEHGRNQLAIYERLVKKGEISLPATQDDFELF